MANSIRPGGRCVAGIDIETGQWIRPVTEYGGGIPESKTLINGQQLSVLDVVELDLNEAIFNTRFQCENQVIRDWNWKIVDRLKPQDVIKYCDNTCPILHCTGDKVAPSKLEKLAPQEWKSLQLIKPLKVSLYDYLNFYNKRRWRANFRDINENIYDLQITDTETCNQLNTGKKLKSDCLFTISMAGPLMPGGVKQEMCFKLVVAVIEL
ncbi:hypothetical protein ACFL50_03920 [Candidatus Latescibacterota bacterium]